MNVRTAESWETVESGVPRIPVGDWIDSGLDWVKSSLGDLLRTVSDVIKSSVEGLTELLDAPPAIVMALVLALVALVARNWRVALTTLVGMLLIIGMEQWHNAMATFALVLWATVIALVIGVPVGILAARSERASRTLRPVLDLMQTMPAMVWLVPFVFLFSIGEAPGLVSTVLFALPPAVRLTELGIRQVDPEVVEAGHAFGAKEGEILRGIQLPLALPTIMAVVNQVIMLALSMAVIAGLVGAGGLGSEVVRSMSRLDVGLGFEAGLSVVVLAIFLDRVTASVGSGDGSRTRRRRWPLGRNPGSKAVREVEPGVAAATTAGATGSTAATHEPASPEDVAAPAR